MNYRKRRFSLFSSQSKNPEKPIHTNPDDIHQISPKYKTTQSTFKFVKKDSIKSKSPEIFEKQTSFDTKNTNDHSKSPIIRYRSLTIAQDNKATTCTTFKKRKYSTISATRQNHTKNEKNYINLISKSLLTGTVMQQQSNEQFIFQSTEISQDESSALAKWRSYEGEEITPRLRQFKILVEGDPLTKIFGNNKMPDVLRKHQNFNKKILKDIRLYRGKPRGPKSIIQWRY